MSTLKKFLVGSVAVVALFVGAASASAAYMHSVTLKMGMTNANVMELQKTLNANGFLVSSVGAGSPGMESMYFGSKTKAAVMAFQTAKGLTPDGVVGANTGLALSAMSGTVSTGGSYPAGCTATSMYSTVTGMPCSGGSSMVPGCASTVGYSPTTGQPCNGTSSSNNGPLSGNAGDITVSSYTSGLETQVGEGANNTKVLGFEVKADAGSDVSLSSVKVAFANSNTTSSRRLTRYVDTVSIWDQNGNKVGSSTASDFSEDSNVYTRSIALSNVVVRADQKARFFVSVDAVDNIDSNDYNNDAWYVGLESIRFSDASGAILTDSQDTTTLSNISSFSSFNRAFGFTSLAGANDLELKVNLASSNLDAQTVKVSTTSQTNNVELLKFTLKAQGGKMMIDQIPVTLTTSGTNLSQVTGNVTLSIDGSEFSESVTATGTTTTVIFNDLNLDLAADETVTGTITADVNSLGVTTPNYGQGTTLQAQIGSLASFDVEDQNGDPVTSGNGDITGSAIGETMTFRSTGVNTVMGTPTITKTTDQNGNITQVQYEIPVTVTSFGNTLYVGQSAQLAGSVTGTNAFNVVYENATSPSAEVTTGTSSVTLSSSASGTGYFRLSDGQSETFKIKVNLIDPAAAGSYRVRIDQIKTFTDTALSAGASASDLLPVESYRTDYQLINS